MVTMLSTNNTHLVVSDVSATYHENHTFWSVIKNTLNIGTAWLNNWSLVDYEKWSLL